MTVEKRVDGKLTPMSPQVNLLAHGLGRFLLWLFGWSVSCETLPGDKFVLIGAPHTSNMDFFFMLITSWSLRLKLHWIGKHTLFWPPIGLLLKQLGGISVDRRVSQGVVDQIADQIKAAKEFILVIAPSGTRRQTDHWKSGFYWIAHKANVPILCGALDYEKKHINLGMSFRPSGDVNADLGAVRAFYEGVQGRFPHEQTTIRLREEAT